MTVKYEHRKGMYITQIASNKVVGNKIFESLEICY